MEESFEIIYIDDEDHNLYVFEDNLEDYFSIKTFKDSRKAISFIESSNSNHLVITDHSMPGVTGLELARSLKNHSHRLKFIMLTANPANDLDLMQNCLKDNLFYEFLKKPLNFNKIFKSLKLFMKALSQLTPNKPSNHHIYNLLISNKSLDSKKISFYKDSCIYDDYKNSFVIIRKGDAWIFATSLTTNLDLSDQLLKNTIETYLK